MLPSIKGGITTAFLFTFIPSFGSPRILGGNDSLMLGNIIARKLTVTRNWPIASSISMVLTVITAHSVLVFIGQNRSSVEKVKEVVIAEKPDGGV